MHCPFCGTNVKEEENYCIKCGKHLPADMGIRLKGKSGFNKFWYIPIVMLLIVVISSGVYYFILQNKTAGAKELYTQGEQLVLDNDYEEARKLFSQALDKNKRFNQAEISIEFMDEAIKAQDSLTQANELLKEGEFQQALSLVSEADNELNYFNGTAVNQIIETIDSNENTIKVAQLSDQLEQEPSIDELKTLLWEAEAISHKEAEAITRNIRNQIIDYSFSIASEQLNQKQFNDAKILVEDGMKYAPDSERLASLETTISKEKLAFETAQQQRIEQAMNTAQEEYELNENDAVDLDSVTVDQDDQGNPVVKGEVKSVATIPINSVLVEYSLLTDNDTEILSNEVFVVPDTLYPEELGEFEITHFDLDEEPSSLNVEVNKITWYTE